jgi:hypothetical protein
VRGAPEAWLDGGRLANVRRSSLTRARTATWRGLVRSSAYPGAASKPTDVAPLAPLPEDGTSVVNHDTWAAFEDEEGRILEWDRLCKLIFFRGLDPRLRRSAWPFLLGVYEPNYTREEREAKTREMRDDYCQLKRRWLSTPSASDQMQDALRDILKDAVRTDRDLPFYNGDDNMWLGALMDVLITATYGSGRAYSQGMSDLLSPILLVMEDEALAFWCFLSLMARIESNFDPQGLVMPQRLIDLHEVVMILCPSIYTRLSEVDMLQFFFAYRWLLLEFRREFKLEEVRCREGD